MSERCASVIALALLLTTSFTVPAQCGLFAHGVEVGQILTINFDPSNPTIACDLAPGTVVAVVSVTGGDGNPVRLTESGDTTDFSLSTTTPPANIIVATGGISSASLSCATIAPAGSTAVVTIKASQ